MPPFLYRCPTQATTSRVWPPMTPRRDLLRPVTCLACAQTHLVNPTTGKVLGSDDE